MTDDVAARARRAIERAEKAVAAPRASGRPWATADDLYGEHEKGSPSSDSRGGQTAAKLKREVDAFLGAAVDSVGRELAKSQRERNRIADLERRILALEEHLTRPEERASPPGIITR